MSDVVNGQCCEWILHARTGPFLTMRYLSLLKVRVLTALRRRPSDVSHHVSDVGDISVYHRVIANTVGYDVFIAYRIAESRPYAKALHDALELQGLVVFLDNSDEGAGTPIDEFVEFACASRCLVVIVTPGIYQSTYVRQEVDAYRERRIGSRWRRAFSRMIPINVDQTLSHAPAGIDTWKELGASVFVSEKATEIEAARPSRDVVDQIVRSGRFVHATAAFAAVLLLLVSGVAISLGGAIWSLVTARTQLTATRTDLAAATRERETLVASNQKLSIEGQALVARNLALGMLDKDPVMAYRLAEYAQGLNHAPETAELIRSVVSSGRLLYDRAVKDCSIDDVASSLILLRCKAGEAKFLSLMDPESFTTTRLPHPAGNIAWIVPLDSTWRLLTEDSVADNRRYRLFDAAGGALGEPVLGRYLTVPDQRCGPTSAFIAQSPAPAGVRWNLISDERSAMRADVAAGFDRAITLACRPDGFRAENPLGKLRLVDLAGAVIAGSETPASFDYIATSASWSPAGTHMAVFVHQGGRIGIWQPSGASFVWLDPDGWVASSYAWSPSGQSFAFAGHTEHQLDSTIELALTSTPAASRKVIFRSERVIKSMAFSADEKSLALLDDEGTLSVISLPGSNIVGRGRHIGATSLQRVQNRFLTISTDEVRSWPMGPSPREQWLFRGDQSSSFAACAAADAGQRWLAAAVTKQHQVTKLAVRDLNSGAESSLDLAADFCHKLEFSENGEWLIFVGNKTTRFWDTKIWRSYDLPLQENDAQYIGLHESSGHVFLHALSGSPLSGKQNDVSYDVLADIGIGPRVVGRETVEKQPSSSCAPAAEGLTAGWHDTFDRSKYSSMARFGCSGVPWETRIWCRDQALGASDCDVEFVPTDLPYVMRKYQSRIWKPESLPTAIP